MDIKNIDLDYLDMATSNFDITDSINYNFENYSDELQENVVNFFKESVYESIVESEED